VTVREVDGATVRYVWVYARPRKSTLNRLLLYVSYSLMSSLVGAVGPRPDVIVASSPPLPVGVAAMLLARRFRCPWIFDVRDVWPEVAVVLGEIDNPRMLAVAEALERRLYSEATAVVTTTEPFREHIAAASPPGTRIEVLPNGTTRRWLEWGAANVARADVGLPEDAFVWTYAGNLGLAQGLEHAVEAAALLGEGFQLCLVGDGPRRRSLEEQAAALPDGAVAFKGLVEPELAARYLRASDATLVCLDPDPRLGWFVPSKLFDACAIGRPVVLAAQGEAARLASEAEAATVVAPGSPEEIVAAVRDARSGSGDRASASAASREFAAAHLREVQAARLVGFSEELASK
jgi:glycosyltransferase involved in cell wall biosynthesis